MVVRVRVLVRRGPVGGLIQRILLSYGADCMQKAQAAQAT